MLPKLRNSKGEKRRIKSTVVLKYESTKYSKDKGYDDGGKKYKRNRKENDAALITLRI